MTTDVDERTELSVTTPAGGGSIKSKKAAEFIAVACLCLLFVMGYVMWQHREDTRESQRVQTEQFKEMSAVNRSMVEALREQTCLISLPENERKAEYAAPYGFCKRFSR